MQRQLTLRALLMGAFLGSILSLSNLYIGLKTGWGLGVAITACILSFSLYQLLLKLFPRFFKTNLTILENNCMQSTASAAGFSTGSTLVSGIAAYILLTGHSLPWLLLTAWTFFVAALGVFLAIPMRRQFIEVEQLPFPSGIAAAETLKQLHQTEKGAAQKARMLGGAGLIGAVIAWLREVGRPVAIPGMLTFPGTLHGAPLLQWTIAFEMSAIMLAAGAIIGLKVTTSLMLGSILHYTVIAPWAAAHGAIDMTHLGFREIIRFGTWGGAAIMISAALTSFAFQWKSIFRTLSTVRNYFATEKTSAVPNAWFVWGTLASGIGVIWLLHSAFDTPWWMGIFAIFFTFFLALVSCRVTGESDITPIGALGKVTQLLFGMLAPGQVATNLMTGATTAGAAASAADLLTDLKSGYLLGANAKQQFLAQFAGIFVGVLVAVPAFSLLVPDASVLGTDKWPAPAAQVWAAVALLLSQGFGALHPMAQLALWVGIGVGVLLAILEAIVPPPYRHWVPSPTGLGLSMVIPFFNSLSMFLGAVVGFLILRCYPRWGKDYLIPLSAGLIAGESVIGILIALLFTIGIL